VLGCVVADEFGPDAAWSPYGFYSGSRFVFLYAKDIASVTIEKGRNPIVQDAMDVDRPIADVGHGRAEPSKMLIRWVIKLNGNMHIGHIQAAHTRRLVWQCVFVGMKGKINDVLYAERPDLLEVVLGWLARRCELIA